ncbi:hypothetical protein A3850_010050 [Lewinella sp. 4G2]|nr:hypothetical protein A3850_010050 [Lewinella sp. 4G2]
MVFCGLSTSLSAQADITIRIPTVEIITADPIVCIPVIADSFPDNIAAMQFSLSWDGDALDFAEARLGDNPFNFVGNDAMISSTDPASFNVSFVSETARGFTVAPGAVMLELCFSREDKKEGDSPIYFRGMNAPEFGDQDTFQPQPFDTIPGRLTYTEAPSGIFTPTAAEPDWGARVNIFPNPYRSGPVTISGDDLPTFSDVTVFNMECREIRHYKGDVRKFNLSALAAGEYAIRLRADGQAVTRNFIKL